MSRLSIALFFVLASSSAMAELLGFFRFEDGETNWQYVANTSGSLLIIALSLTLLRLFFIHRAANRYNHALEEIRSQLEGRVLERTATLDESNRLLQENHRVLEGEIAQHQATAARLRQSESYINSILRSMPLMLIGVSRDGTITQWNPRAEEVSGLEADKVLGENLWSVYPFITVTPKQVEDAIANNKILTIKQNQRGQFHFDVTMYPLSERDNPGIVILIDDVSQRVVAENMLIQRDKMSSMGELAGSLAQDITTPVHAMLMDIREVQSRVANLEYPVDRDPGPMIDDALLRGEQVSAVISNLLKFSSGYVGDMQPVGIPGIIDHTLELASAVLTVPSGLQFRDIKIVKAYEDDLPAIPCHETELQQVFLSLFRHCSHALGEVEKPGFQPTITIEVNKFYDALWLKVQHNGRGISLNDQQMLFEPFFTDSDNLAEEDYDAGRRLSYPYFIITEQHRGQLAVTSDTDVGTTFHIQLQLV
jgi:PAS domain S-box-containing protein